MDTQEDRRHYRVVDIYRSIVLQTGQVEYFITNEVVSREHLGGNSDVSVGDATWKITRMYSPTYEWRMTATGKHIRSLKTTVVDVYNITNGATQSITLKNTDFVFAIF